MKIQSALFIIFFSGLITGIPTADYEAKDNTSISKLKSETLISEDSMNHVPKGWISINDISVIDMEGKEIKLSDYNGKVLLIVNVASQCGYTPQYRGLEEVYKEYKSKEFEILAFPCNDFGGQEPGTKEEIKEFCTANYGVTFKLFDKVKIIGRHKAKLYERLTSNGVTGNKDIKWNFEKFIISKKGEIVARFPSRVEPTDPKIIDVIDAELGK